MSLKVFAGVTALASSTQDLDSAKLPPLPLVSALTRSMEPDIRALKLPLPTFGPRAFGQTLPKEAYQVQVPVPAPKFEPTKELPLKDVLGKFQWYNVQGGLETGNYKDESAEMNLAGAVNMVRIAAAKVAADPNLKGKHAHLVITLENSSGIEDSSSIQVKVSAPLPQLNKIASPANFRLSARDPAVQLILANRWKIEGTQGVGTVEPIEGRKAALVFPGTPAADTVGVDITTKVGAFQWLTPQGEKDTSNFKSGNARLHVSGALNMLKEWHKKLAADPKLQGQDLILQISTRDQRGFTTVSTAPLPPLSNLPTSNKQGEASRMPAVDLLCRTLWQMEGRNGVGTVKPNDDTTVVVKVKEK